MEAKLHVPTQPADSTGLTVPDAAGAAPGARVVDGAAGSWRRAFRDLPREHGFEPLRVEGRLPAELRGTLYRNGPSLFSSFGRRYGHWFDGDGAVSAVRLDGEGGARGAVRVVQSDGLLAERRAGRALYAGYGTAPRGLLGRLRAARGDIKNIANTSVMVWQGRLYAMVESSHPVELSVEDLATLGERDLGGVVTRAFSAHPHYVPERRAAYNFGVRYGRRTLLELFELPDDGPARKLGEVPLAGASMVHDFVATPRYLVFFVPPLRLRILRMLLGVGSYSDNLAWRPGQGTEVIVVPIDDPARATRFTAEAFYQWHFANAFERGGELVIDLVRYADFRSNGWLREITSGAPSSAIDGTLQRAVVDPARGTLRAEPLWDRACEFPRVAASTCGRASRWVYVATHSGDAAGHGPWDRLAAVDLARGDATVVALGAGQYPSEPVFVRRPGASTENDGWLLSLVYDAPRDASHLAVLDARAPADGPIARAWFDHHVPFTFHGVFHRAPTAQA